MKEGTWPEGVPRKENFPPDISEAYNRLCRTVLRLAERQQQILELLIGDHLAKRAEPMTHKDILSIIYGDKHQPSTVREAMSSLRGRLNEYIHTHPEDLPRIFLPDPYRLIIHGSKATVSESSDDVALLSKLECVRLSDGTERQYHCYHLTVGPARGPFWSYKIARFKRTGSNGPLRATITVLPRPGIKDPVERREHEYIYDVSTPKTPSRLELKILRAGSLDLEGVEMYPKVSSHREFPWCGLELIYRTFVDSVATSICLLHKEQFEFAKTTESGKVIEDGDPITDEGIMQRLNETWERRAKHPEFNILRLPQSIG